MITPDDGEAGAAGSHPGRVLATRGRTESDLDECVNLMAEVHRRDGYPLRWPADPRRFLGTSKIFAAWVATVDGQVAGHVALSVASPDDAAPQLLGVTCSAPAGGDTADDGEMRGTGGAAGGGGVAAGDSGGVAMVSRLFVGAAARGYGAGRALMQQATEAAHERGLHLLLDVHSANTSAIALYERLGWNFIGTSRAQWGPDQVTLLSYTAPSRLRA
ncbi:MAG TPA: GNAT family N-acetyltransferase [Streptosporangiaceae bacterium]|jgi:ribosomal protein S18 acetylase RimI-like enzyme